MMYRILILITLASCAAGLDKHDSLILSVPDIVIESTDSSLHFVNGFLELHGNPFSGIVTERHENGKVFRQTGYVNGKEEGWTLSYFSDGAASEKRYYHLGEKDSVHTGWWPNGHKRFEYHFNTGLYNGSFNEWYEGGERYKQLFYANGKEVKGTGWRQNGKVYMNFIVKNGRRYGLENANLCYTLKNEKGEYVNSVK